MTVSDTIVAQQYTYSGSGTFAFAHPFLDDTDITVTHTTVAGVETTLVLTTDYTVSGTPDSLGHYTSGADIVVTYAMVNGDKITVERTTALTQSAAYGAVSKFPAQTHEGALDKLTYIVQELYYNLTRTIKASPSTSPSVDLTAPIPTANRAIMWNGTADGLVNSTYNPDDAGTAAASAAADAATASAAAISAAADAASAAVSAATINLPSIVGKALNFLRVNAGETGYEHRTAAQVRTDLSLGSLALLSTVTTSEITANAVTPAKFETKKLVGSYFEIGNVVAAGGSGGTATTGSTQTLTINTEISDGDSLVSIAANDFTITGAGSFNLSGFQNFYAGASNSNSELELYDVTDAAVVATVYCMPSWAAGVGNTQVVARIFGKVTQAGTKTYRIRYRVGATQATTGLGVGTGSNSVVHGYFKFIKES